MKEVTVEGTTIDAALNELDLKKDEVDLPNFVEFLLFNGLHESNSPDWIAIHELWWDWQMK